MRLIRRYANRKLYDVEKSRYISLKELGSLLSSGAKVRVEQADSGEDITLRTLARLRLVEAEETFDRVRTLPDHLRQRLEQGWSDLRLRVGSIEDRLTQLRRQVTEPLNTMVQIARKLEHLDQQLDTLTQEVERLRSEGRQDDP